MEQEKGENVSVVAINVFDYIQKDLKVKENKGLNLENDKMARPINYENLTQMMILLQAKHVQEKGTPLFKEPIQSNDHWNLEIIGGGLEGNYDHSVSANLTEKPAKWMVNMEPEERKWLEKNVKDIMERGECFSPVLAGEMKEILTLKYERPGEVKASDLKELGQKLDKYRENPKQFLEEIVERQKQRLAGIQKPVEEKPLAHKKEAEKKVDNVNHPSHYANQGQVECIDFVGAMVNKYPGIIAGDLQNVTKYTWRSHGKNGKEDIEKASWYFNHAEKTYLSLDTDSKKMLREASDAMQKVILAPGKTLTDMEKIKEQGFKEVTKNMGLEEKKLYQKVLEGIKHFYNDKVREVAKKALLEWSRSYDNFKEMKVNKEAKQPRLGIQRNISKYSRER